MCSRLSLPKVLGDAALLGGGVTQSAAGVDDEAKQRVVALVEQMYRFSHQTKAREMELWGHVQNVMEASGVHQLLAQLEQKLQEETTSFAEVMYKYVDDCAGQLEKTLAAYWEEIRGGQITRNSRGPRP